MYHNSLYNKVTKLMAYTPFSIKMAQCNKVSGGNCPKRILKTTINKTKCILAFNTFI